VTSTEGGTGVTASASLTVTAAATLPPTIAKSFENSSIAVNGTTFLNFTLGNPNGASSLTGVGYTDALPAGLVVTNPSDLSGRCNGTLTATPGSGSINLSGASLAAGTSCSLSVSVTATTAGTKNNTTGSVTSVEGGTGGTASATLNVTGTPPPPPTTVTAIPTLQQWVLALLALALTILAAVALQRRYRQR